MSRRQRLARVTTRNRWAGANDRGVGANLLGRGGGASGITQLTGDLTAGPGSGSQAATLANTAVTAGSYTAANITVDGGRLPPPPTALLGCRAEPRMISCLRLRGLDCPAPALHPLLLRRGR